jgi:myosin heavy subunit
MEEPMTNDTTTTPRSIVDPPSLDASIREANAVCERLAGLRDAVETHTAGCLERVEQRIRELHEAMATAAQVAGAADEAMQALDRRAQDVQEQSAAALARLDDRARVLEEAIARELTADQGHQSEEHRRVVDELAQQVARGVEMTRRFEEIKDGAMAVYAQLTERSEAAAALFERSGALVEQVSKREDEIDLQGRVLAQLHDEREALELRLQQISAGVESLRVELASLLAEPQKTICEAKTQTLQLSEVCRAVKKVFAGLSQASLQANRRIEELRRVEGVAGALQHWVGETARAQQRLSSALAPAREGDASVPPNDESEGGKEPTAAVTRSPAVRSASTRDEAMAAARAAAQRSKAQKIDHLIRHVRSRDAAKPAPAPA